MTKIINGDTLKRFIIILLGLTWSAVSYAHGNYEGNSFMSGATHPIFGFDHLLAMVSVGVLSIQIGGRALWVVPLSFLFLMLMGSIIGLLGVPLVAVESCIALSVLLLGLAIAFDKKTPLIWSMVFVGFFAMFHGYAHSSEIPTLANPSQYAIGFLLSTTLLHIVGMGIGECMKIIPKGTQLLRVAGLGVAGVGAFILSGV